MVENGTTHCKWDTVIPFVPLWEAYKRVIKPGGAIVLTCSQPFTSMLIMSNLKMLSYLWYWKKSSPTGFQNAKKQPMRVIEDILVFGKPAYHPQGLVRFNKNCCNSKSTGGDTIRVNVKNSRGCGSLRTPGQSYVQEFTNYPVNLLEFSSDKTNLHPTQKPVALFEYLIKTYTNPGELVLDNCLGSGTTGVACLNTSRHYIGIEKDDEYFKIAVNRIRTQQNEIASVLQL